MSLPGPKTTLTLYELTVTQGTTGSSVKTWASVQTLDGSLQPLSAREEAKFNKDAVTADYKFIVAQSQFSSSANEAKLVEKNQMRIGTRIFDIIFKGARLEGPIPHYSVILKEIA